MGHHGIATQILDSRLQITATVICCPNVPQRAGQVVAERQGEDDTHPVESGNHRQLDEACAVLHVHEVEDDDQRLEAGDRECDDGIHPARDRRRPQPR